MVTFFAWLVYLSIVYPMYSINKFTIILKLGAIASSVMLFVFTLKFLFKKKAQADTNYIEILEEDYPELFAFIRALCAETGASFPKKVFINSEINAAVFYDNPLQSLFFPARKNLLIGLGLVNSINLAEFKAVLAHEFGHFAQSSMRMGSYVYQVNKLIHDMVFGRDSWDQALEEAKNSGSWAVVFAGILSGIVFLLRTFLVQLYKIINMIYASLQRQMEFNADLVAVSVTGSDPIITGLAKLEPASNAMGMTMYQLKNAMDHELYSSDIFFHHQKNIQVLNQLAKDKGKEPTYDYGKDAHLFTNESDYQPPMYASHPSNLQRELNAKKKYVPGIVDSRSPWLLFGANAGQLRNAVSKSMYGGELVNVAKFTSPEEVDEFIQAELQEIIFDKRYCDVYDVRNMQLLDLENLDHYKAISDTIPNLQVALDEMYNVTLKDKMSKFNTLNQELQKLNEIANGQNTVKQFQFRDTQYRKTDAPELGKQVLAEMEPYFEWFKPFDEKILAIHIAMAAKQPAAQQELLDRYKFQNLIIKLQQQILEIQNHLFEDINSLRSLTQVTESDLASHNMRFKSRLKELTTLLNSTNNVLIPALKNMDQNTSLRSFLAKEIVKEPSQGTFQWVNDLAAQLQEIKSRLDRLYHKSLGNILTLQEQIASNYARREEHISTQVQ
ncbi:MAG: M48 family metalloprotease [Chitinophagales bacterium]|nr:M48 family metalloprotease [Chitinophagales bacterium]